MTEARGIVLALLIATVGACRAAVPEGRFACRTAAECPAGWSCRTGYCYSTQTAMDSGDQGDDGAPDEPDVSVDPVDVQVEETPGDPTTCTPACGANSSCVMGSCVCATGFADCNASATDGCEVSLATDVNHCNGCATSCPMRANATRTCTSGTCGFTCDVLFDDCNGVESDGCETRLDTETDCGTCGNACAGSRSQCCGGACQNLNVAGQCMACGGTWCAACGCPDCCTFAPCGPPCGDPCFGCGTDCSTC